MASKKIKTRNLQSWSEADFNSHIKGILRDGMSMWKPKQQCIKNAKVSYGRYRCNMCKQVGPKTLPPLPGRKLRRNNITADHIQPVVDPYTGCLLPNGKVDWNSVIERMYIELDGFQALCWNCHVNIKSKKENAIAAQRRRREKGELKNESK